MDRFGRIKLNFFSVFNLGAIVYVVCKDRRTNIDLNRELNFIQLFAIKFKSN